MAKLKRAKVCGGTIRAGIRTQNNSLFGMAYLQEKKTN